MSHLVVFSDLHLHPYEQFSTIDPDRGINSRLQDGFDVLAQIREYCITHGIHYCLNGGDLLHKGAAVSVDLLYWLMEELIEFREADIEFISIVGQHDFLKRDGSYNFPKSLGRSELMTVLDRPGDFTTIDDVRIIGCSYRYGLEAQQEALTKCGQQLRKGRHILLGHFLLREILEQNAAPFDMSGYVGLEDLPHVNYVLLGDYHYHVQLKDNPIVSIGGACQHQWGDRNRPQGGFLDFDLDTMTFERIPVEAPMFIEVSPDDKFPGDYDPRNFYKIKVVDQRQEDRIRANLTDHWQCTFEPIVEAEEETTQQEAERLSLGFDLTPEQCVREYSAYMNKSELVDMGIKFLG